MKNFTLSLFGFLLLCSFMIKQDGFSERLYAESSGTEETCTYKLICYAGDENGWPYQYVSILVDEETVVEQHNFTGKTTDTVYFEVTSGKHLIVTAQGAEGWAAYKIFDSKDDLIFQDGFNYTSFQNRSDDTIQTNTCITLYSDAEVLYADIPRIMNPGSITPKAYVFGAGVNDVSFDVTLTIGESYTSTKTVTSLSRNDTVAVEFDDWTATKGEYSVEVVCSLTGDENTGNDSYSRNVVVDEGKIMYANYNTDLVAFFDDDYENYYTITPVTAKWQAQGPNNNFSFSSFLAIDNKILATMESNVPTTWLIDPVAGTQKYIEIVSDNNYDMFIPEGLAYDSVSGKIYLSNAETKKFYELDRNTYISTEILELSRSGAYGLCFGPDGRLYTLNNNYVSTIDLNTGYINHIIRFEDNIDGWPAILRWDNKNNHLLIFGTNNETKISARYSFDPLNKTITKLADFPSDIKVTAMVSFADTSSNGAMLSVKKDIYVSGFSSVFESGVALTSKEVAVYLTNGGTDTITSVDVSFLVSGDDESEKVITETLETKLAPRASVLYNFVSKADLSTWGTTYSIKAYTSLTGDERLYNDTIIISGIENIAPCIIDYPEGATYENETCGESTNNGCQGDYSNPVYDTITDGETIYGTSWKTDYINKDYDWYLVNIKEPKEITIVSKASFHNVVELLKLSEGTCSYNTLVSESYQKCNSDTIQLQLVDTGNYIISIVPSNFVDVLPCGEYNNYTINLSLSDVDSYCLSGLYTGGCATGDGISDLFLNSFKSEKIICGFQTNSSVDWFFDYTDNTIYVQSGDSMGVNFGGSSMNNYVSAWIDFNDDKIYSQDEKVIDNGLVESAGTLTYLPITFVDSVVTTGEHTMRIRSSVWFSQINGACDILGSGNLFEIKVLTGEIHPVIDANISSFAKEMNVGKDSVESLTISNTGLISMDNYSVTCIFNEELSVDEADSEINLQYGTGEYAHSAGPMASEMYAAVYWPADSIWKYYGASLKAIDIYTGFGGDNNNLEYTLYVWDEATSSKPGDVIYSKPFSSADTSWNTVSIDTTIMLNGKGLWFGYHVSGITESDYPFGTDAGPLAAEGQSDLGSADGKEWLNSGYGYNWLIKAKLEGKLQSPWMYAETSNLEPIAVGNSQDVNLHFLGLAEGTYSGTILITCKNAEVDSVEIPVTLSVTNATSIQDEITSKSLLNVYPNPANEILNIDLSAIDSHVNITIYDITGKIVYRDNNVVSGNKSSIKIAEIPEGNYILKVTNDEINEIMKVVIRH